MQPLLPVTRPRSAHCREQSAAGILAPAAGLGADTAVLVVWRVTLAFVPAHTAGQRTCFDHGAKNGQISFGLTDRDPGGRRADVAAVEAEANAPSHVPDVRLSQVRIRATRASIRTVRALGDTANERRAVNARRLGVCIDDLLDGHALLLRLTVNPSFPRILTAPVFPPSKSPGARRRPVANSYAVPKIAFGG
jgi:hypothetical protein